MIIIAHNCTNDDCPICATRIAMRLCEVAAVGTVEAPTVERTVLALRMMPAEAIDMLEANAEIHLAQFRDLIAAVRVFRENDTQPIDTNDKGGN